MENNGSKTLIGLKMICEYLEITKPTFYQFVQMGLPARIVNKRWYAHKENIDAFFKHLTHNRVTEIEKDAN